MLAPRFAGTAQRATDAIDEANPVIVAGFGRFGQVVARVLRGMDIRATVIDHDPSQIELVRRFGWKAYYGDATRVDLLERPARRARGCWWSRSTTPRRRCARCGARGRTSPTSR